MLHAAEQNRSDVAEQSANGMSDWGGGFPGPSGVCGWEWSQHPDNPLARPVAWRPTARRPGSTGTPSDQHSDCGTPPEGALCSVALWWGHGWGNVSGLGSGRAGSDTTKGRSGDPGQFGHAQRAGAFAKRLKRWVPGSGICRPTRRISIPSNPVKQVKQSLQNCRVVFKSGKV